MTAIDTNRTATMGAATNVFSMLFNTVSAWNDARVTRKALSKLSDRELEDIGLNRGDIDSITA